MGLNFLRRQVSKGAPDAVRWVAPTSRDGPDSLTQAMDQVHHGPMLTVNVGIRHWRCCARWFEHEGFGWYTGLRAPMVIGGEHMPLDPGKRYNRERCVGWASSRVRHNRGSTA